MTILNAWTCDVMYDWLLVVFFIIALATVIFISVVDMYKTRNIIIGLLGVAICISCIIGIFTFKKGTITKYKVIFDGSVSLTEILDKYGIVDQEGVIFTIEDKEITKG